MNRRRDARAAVPKLRHEEAVQYLVEYHFGRLSPQLNTAVEAHIRECKICQRQGLNHAATEKREVARRLRRVRPSKQRLSNRGRGVIVFLAIVAVLQIAVVEISRGSLFSSRPAALTATPSATSSPTPAPLTAGLTYASSSSNASALALSPDGKTLATVSLNGSTPTVTLWATATGKPGATLTWTGQSTPGSLSWSPDGKSLAAADGAFVGVWVLSSATPAWTLTLPTAPALRVYDVKAGARVQQPGAAIDATTVFNSGSVLRWGAGGALDVVNPSGSMSPVTASGQQQIGLWRAEGSHIFSDGKSGALVGATSANASKRPAILSWSPDGLFLLWATMNRQVAVPAPQQAATATASATTGTTPAGSTPVPNPIVGALATDVATSGHGDALVWFSSDGRFLAACDRTGTSTALNVYDIASNRIVGQLSGVCTQMTTASLVWQSSPSALILAVPGKPVSVYSMAAGGDS